MGRHAHTQRHGYIDLPEGWQRVGAEGAGPFVSAEVLRRPDGTLMRWHSRSHRKRAAESPNRSGIWWRPDRLSWWIGVLFAVGSSCFLVAAVACQVSDPIGEWVGPVFFAGSIFFTSAAYLQYSQAVNVDHSPLPGSLRRRRRPASWEPRRIDWLACAVQLGGTLAFNVSTFAAMNDTLSTRKIDLRVWSPDVVGSICFLVASELALAEVCRRWVCLKGRSLPWRIAALNMVGSVAFGVAAAASLIEPSTNEPVSAGINNVGTALGALCFLVGGVLLLPESAAAERPAPASRHPKDAPTGAAT